MRAYVLFCIIIRAPKDSILLLFAFTLTIRLMKFPLLMSFLFVSFNQLHCVCARTTDWWISRRLPWLGTSPSKTSWQPGFGLQTSSLTPVLCVSTWFFMLLVFHFSWCFDLTAAAFTVWWQYHLSCHSNAPARQRRGCCYRSYYFHLFGASQQAKCQPWTSLWNFSWVSLLRLI